MGTLAYTGELVVTSCWCGIMVGIPEQLYRAAKKDHRQSVYCPLGHSFVYTGDTELQQERKWRQQAEDMAAAERARADQAERSARAYKGQTTKLRKRALTGTCAFCRRHFVNVERHVATCHPGETPEVEA
jgi:hypothetical protein